MNSWIDNTVSIPKVNDPWPAGFKSKSLQLLRTVSTPRYGYNPLRWLFRRPKYWTVSYTFESS